ncbi:MAG: zinc-dependent alcohol dehydrogenase family protein [Planctomycetes bacterium]|nr:zinc-dependent alcohol dehydrogenase family protein [Planctomycetota bacterium]
MGDLVKACVLHQPGPVRDRPLRCEQVPTPEPPAGHLLIRVRACGVCRTDLHIVEGELPMRRSPVIPGHQVVGTVAGRGASVAEDGGFDLGTRVGVAWLYGTCGACRWCRSARENLCEQAEFTGWTRDGGYAEYVVARADFVYPLPHALNDHQAAPLLCAGIIGYRCLRRCGLADWAGARLGIYGFGAAGHIAIQIARARGADVYVCTRDRQRHQPLAEQLGAVWVGGATEAPPSRLDAAIVFAPAGEIVPAALQALDRGGRLVLGGIHMSPIPSIDYQDLYWERGMCSVANNTREDGREFLEEAARIGVRTHVQTMRLDQANDALIALKHDAIRGAAVLEVD